MEKCKDCEVKYPDHSAQLNRLSRIEGQLRGIRSMIEERRYCPEIITQVKAARSALMSLETSLLERHLECCVTTALKSSDEFDAREKIAELLQIFKHSG